MKLEVPFFSQLNNEISEDLQRQSCGICCVKMVIDYFAVKNKNKKNATKVDSAPISDLMKEGELIEAYNPSVENGVWTHEGLVRILRNHGVPAYAQEFRSVGVNLETGEFEDNENQKDLLQIGIEKILFRLKKGYPVIASVREGFSENKVTHLIVITGFEKDDSVSFIINDPLRNEETVVTLEHFLEYWRKFVIFSR
jgi:hypothetical protein